MAFLLGKCTDNFAKWLTDSPFFAPKREGMVTWNVGSSQRLNRFCFSALGGKMVSVVIAAVTLNNKGGFDVCLSPEANFGISGH